MQINFILGSSSQMNLQKPLKPPSFHHSVPWFPAPTETPKLWALLQKKAGLFFEPKKSIKNCPKSKVRLQKNFDVLGSVEGLKLETPPEYILIY